MFDKSKQACEQLEFVVNLYADSSWNDISRYLLYLAGSCVFLGCVSASVLTLPRQLAPRILLGALLLFNLLVLAPYFVLNAHRNAMILRRLGIRNQAQLQRAAEICKTQYLNEIDLKIGKRSYVYEGGQSWWEAGAVIIVACVTGLLALRIVFLTVLRTRGTDIEPTNQSSAIADMELALSHLQVATDSECDEQCAICLEELRSATACRTPCNHMFHEKCIAQWIRTARSPTCPMCKANIFPPEASVQSRSNHDPSAPPEPTNSNSSDPPQSTASQVERIHSSQAVTQSEEAECADSPV